MSDLLHLASLPFDFLLNNIARIAPVIGRDSHELEQLVPRQSLPDTFLRAMGFRPKKSKAAKFRDAAAEEENRAEQEERDPEEKEEERFFRHYFMMMAAEHLSEMHKDLIRAMLAENDFEALDRAAGEGNVAILAVMAHLATCGEDHRAFISHAVRRKDYQAFRTAVQGGHTPFVEDLADLLREIEGDEATLAMIDDTHAHSLACEHGHHHTARAIARIRRECEGDVCEIPSSSLRPAFGRAQPVAETRIAGLMPAFMGAVRDRLVPDSAFAPRLQYA